MIQGTARFTLRNIKDISFFDIQLPVSPAINEEASNLCSITHRAIISIQDKNIIYKLQQIGNDSLWNDYSCYRGGSTHSLRSDIQHSLMYFVCH